MFEGCFLRGKDTQDELIFIQTKQAISIKENQFRYIKKGAKQMKRKRTRTRRQVSSPSLPFLPAIFVHEGKKKIVILGESTQVPAASSPDAAPHTSQCMQLPPLSPMAASYSHTAAAAAALGMRIAARLLLPTLLPPQAHLLPPPLLPPPPLPTNLLPTPHCYHQKTHLLAPPPLLPSRFIIVYELP